MKYLLGIDLGSSSVKVALVEVESGRCAATASYPKSEAPIKALQPGWAEQRPEDWWEYLKECVNAVMCECDTNAITQSHNNAIKNNIAAIGISYQMHGLVCLDKDLKPLRDAIIWCDSRGVAYGQKAFDEIGHERCLSHLLNSPGNFTAAKLAWVKENEPQLYEKIRYVMLPGDYIAMRLGAPVSTTACGLSEMMLYDYSDDASTKTFKALMDHFGFREEIIPALVPTFGEQGRVSAKATEELGLPAGIPISYRAGDQPNNALSLAVLNPGEVAATAGTSGVVYSISDQVKYDPLSRINTFLHVNHRLKDEDVRLGVMHCINGCGILNAWMHRNVAPHMSYDEMNRLAATAAVGSEGISIIPFGNGAERVMENREMNSSIHGLNFNRHTVAHLLRATQEGIVFALYYGMEIINNLASNDAAQRTGFKTIHAGNANMFLSPLFREALASVSGATIELYDTDGAIGAARAAGYGCGIYSSLEEAFATLNRISLTEPSPTLSNQYKEAYNRWKTILEENQENLGWPRKS